MIGGLRHRSDAFGDDHMPPHGDPLLRIADAIAWSSSAGGARRDRVDPIISIAQDVTGP